MGKVKAISVSERKGEKKHNIPEAKVIESVGIEGDAHAEGGGRQVSLLMEESIDRIKKEGLSVTFGDFAENIVTSGADLRNIRLGDTIRIGDDCVLRVTKIGKECHAPCIIGRTIGYCIMPDEGVFCAVTSSGLIRVGDSVVISS
ncbi:MAG TPA: MOSC domain-containing protein [Spirochaetota bacterium]|nr:MOSC domain-containing protein [Spirochaetota bacterium]